MDVVEKKRERFKRLATQRTNTVLKKLQVLGNCANRQAYEYTEDEVKKIFSAIEKQVTDAKSQFHFIKETKFKLQNSRLDSRPYLAEPFEETNQPLLGERNKE